jgi:hypothetical protein
MGRHGVHTAQVDERVLKDRSVRRTSNSQLPVSAREPEPSPLQGNDAPHSEGNTSRAHVLTPEAEGILPDDSSFSYIGLLPPSRSWMAKLTIVGDKRGPRYSVYDLCHPGTPQDARPYVQSKESSHSRNPYEVVYMRHEGAFATLPDDVCDDLIRCYFQHVHFFLPIVDAPTFLNEYISNGCRKISPLLFWSMLLAAANVSALLLPCGRLLVDGVFQVR